MVWRMLLLFAGVVGASVPSAVAAEPDAVRWGVQSFGVRTAYGIGDRSNLQFASLLPRVTFFLPQLIDQPLAEYGVQAEFVVEGIVSYITNKSTDTVEVGVNPLVLSVRYDRGQSFVPFFEGGEGVLYNGIQGERLGGPFQFSSQAGFGLHWFLDRTMALSLSYRFRHISNAGIKQDNLGLNTNFFMLGVTLFPTR